MRRRVGELKTENEENIYMSYALPPHFNIAYFLHPQHNLCLVLIL